MYNSDLEWLPLSERKNIDLPRIVYEPFEDQNYSGYYEHHSKTLTIVLLEEENLVSTIAHEFRHYTQELRSNLPSSFEQLAYFEEFSYNKATRMYYRESWHEMDALLFQHKVAPTAVTKFLLKACVLPKTLDENVTQ